MRNSCGDVVLVDGDPAFRSFLTGVLERAAYATVSVANAQDAMTTIAAGSADIVLTDVELPDVSGYELCRQLKVEYGASLPIIMISGTRTEPFDRAAGILLGADDYMVKPIDAGELIARVWRLVRCRPQTNGAANRVDTKLDVLSTRERQVLALLSEGADQDQIAATLFISPKTVATHIQRTLTKLGVRSRTQAVALALRREPA
jgi:DNA-binding NarL/FixJ family response regulator